MLQTIFNSRRVFCNSQPLFLGWSSSSMPQIAICTTLAKPVATAVCTARNLVCFRSYFRKPLPSVSASVNIALKSRLSLSATTTTTFDIFSLPPRSPLGPELPPLFDTSDAAHGACAAILEIGNRFVPWQLYHSNDIWAKTKSISSPQNSSQKCTDTTRCVIEVRVESSKV